MAVLNCDHHGVVCQEMIMADTHEEALELLEAHKEDVHHVNPNDLSPAHQHAFLAWMDRLDR